MKSKLPDEVEILIEGSVYDAANERATRLDMDVVDYIEQAIAFAIASEDLTEEYRNGGGSDEAEDAMDMRRAV